MAVGKAPTRNSRAASGARPRPTAKSVPPKAKPAARGTARFASQAKAAAKPRSKTRAKTAPQRATLKRATLKRAALKRAALTRATVKRPGAKRPGAKRLPAKSLPAKSGVAAKAAPQALRTRKRAAPRVAARRAKPQPVKPRPPARVPREAPRRKTEQPPERKVAQFILDAAAETKAEAMRLFDLRGESSITDYVLIASGRSQGHVRGIADKIGEQLKKSGRHPRSVEGYAEGSWIVMDYDVVIAHIFHPETRAYYDLDALLKPYPVERFAEREEPGAGE